MDGADAFSSEAGAVAVAGCGPGWPDMCEHDTIDWHCMCVALKSASLRPDDEFQGSRVGGGCILSAVVNISYINL